MTLLYCTIAATIGVLAGATVMLFCTRWDQEAIHADLVSATAARDRLANENDRLRDDLDAATANTQDLLGKLARLREQVKQERAKEHHAYFANLFSRALASGDPVAKTLAFTEFQLADIDSGGQP